ncbi:MAG: hypothetical protein JSS86_09610 [Cyanobacteria bacterium SZAS LIN-2]|nr:hypothetical protein [Cyanobacteria bacterium SZAS LIN-2]
MAGFDQGRNQEGDGKSGTPQNGGGALLDAYMQAAQRTGERTERRDGTADGAPLTPMPAAQVQFFDMWRQKERAILEYNLTKDADGGAHLQNSVYNYTKLMLKQEGLDKQGWEALPVAMNSPLDKIGADIILLNRKTGDIVFLDPTSRRLDPRTGEQSSAADNGKTNVPSLRAGGVVDALPRWFDRSTGALDTHSDNPEMHERVMEFQDRFRYQLHDLTSQPSPFNMKDFPIPSTYPVKDQAVEVQQIQKVVDWAQKKATEARQQGDIQTARMQDEFGNMLRNGALNFSKRTGSENLTSEMDRTVNRVIVEEAMHRAYPKLFKEAASGQRNFQRLEDGSDIRADKSGNLIVDLKTPGKPGDNQVITAGSLTDSFRKATSHWSGGLYDPAKKAEFYELLPKSAKKLVDSGQVKIEKIMAEIANDRNAFAAGGAGVERAFIGRVVTRMANHKAEGLRRVLEGAAHEVTAPVEATAPVAARTVPEPTHLGRPQAGGNGRWEPGTAPKPQVGKVDLPANARPGEVVKPVELPEHLTVEEVKAMQRYRQALESKGSNINQGDREQIAGFKYAEQELSRPLNGDKNKIELVQHIRGLMGREARGAALSLAMVSVAVLQFYHAHQAEIDESQRATFN